MSFDESSAKSIMNSNFDESSAVSLNKQPPGSPWSLLHKAGFNLTNPSTALMNPPMSPSDLMSPLTNAARYAMSAAGIPEEKLYPIVGGIAGEMAGSRIGMPNVGAGIGSGLGSLSEEMTKKRRGGQPNYINPLINGVFGYGLGKLFHGGEDLINAIHPSSFLKRGNQAIEKTMGGAPENFGEGMQKLESMNPKAVDFNQPINNIDKMVAQLDPIPNSETIMKVLENVPSYQKILSKRGVEGLSNLSLPESQQIIREFGEEGITRAMAKGDVAGSERSLEAFQNSLRNAQDIAHSGMQEIREPYGAIQEAYKTSVKGQSSDFAKLVGPKLKAAEVVPSDRALVGARLSRQAQAFGKPNKLANATFKVGQGAVTIAGGLKLSDFLNPRKATSGTESDDSAPEFG